MIVPMKKISLIILGDKRQETLKKLRKLGLMHIEITEGSSNRLTELKKQISSLAGSIFTLEERAKKNTASQNADTEKALSIANEVSALAEDIKTRQAQIINLSSQLEAFKAWGEIDPKQIEDLKAKGVELSLYEMPTAEYDGLDNALKTLVLARNKHTVKFAVINSGEIEDGSLNNYRLELPKASTAEMQSTISDLQSQIQSAEERLVALSGFAQSMKTAIKALEKEVEFQTYASGMENEALSEEKQSLSVAHFNGYIDAGDLENLKLAAKENSWGLLISDPTEEDNVPTKLKNNKFVSLIYPLTDFLGTVPGYFEYDISSWFLGFILIFFGIIFGDGGYGLLITAVAAIPIIKSLITRQRISPTFLLVGLFGLSTILWGTLTCTWLGLTPEQLPQWLKSLSIPVISNVYADKIWHPFWTNGEVGLTTAQNLQIFCFSLALVQLTVAHIKGAFRNRKSLKMLGDIGSILQLLGIYYVVLSLVVNPQVFSFSLTLGGIPVGTAAIALVGIGFATSFVFSNYEGSIIKSVLSSLTNIVSVLLGVVNVFSDIVSYIRLWAVGLAGAAISATVNELAGPLLGNFMFMILAIVLLVFGHGLNMILNVLSVIVHGIRLNTLEFSSHLDMSWSGHKFKPFEE